MARGEVHIRREVPADDALWQGLGLALLSPVEVDLRAQSVGEGVLVRGRLRARLGLECRRCLEPVELDFEAPVDFLYEPMASEEEERELSGEVYPLPPRGDELALGPAVREQLVLQIPSLVVCRESCRGLCPQCGANLNETTCSCVPETGGNPWDALKTLKFD
ncbi:MAG TPA: DUF177 domain-containing protein [Longimicrobiaceae bacterium]|nr:DUF177 domain-containing protein [Longimicrobiaceae bacterium]